MALEEMNGNGNGMVMPVSPMYGNGNGGSGNWNGDGFWIILLFILLGGWNNNGFGGAGSGMNGGLYPWINQSNQINDGIRDLMAANNASTQKILDQLCADKIEAKNDLIAQLRSELMYARGQASQDVQTAAIQAGQRALANEVEQYVLPTPRPAYIVQNPACACNNFGCGCGA